MPRRFIYPASPISVSEGAAAFPGYTPPQEPPSEPRVVYFSWDGETGNLSDWTGLSATVPTISTAFAHGGTYSMECFYQIPSPTPAHQDANIYAYKTITEQPDNIFMRGYVYHKSPEVGGSAHQVNRKQMWLGYDSGTTYWTCGLTTDSTSTPSPAGMVLRFFVNGSAACGVGTSNAIPQYDLDAALWDSWHCFEIQVVLNTPSVNNGIVRVWYDGTMVTEDLDMNIRGSCTTGIGYVSFGRQADRINGEIVSEKRYWDDIVVANSYTGV